MTRGVLDEVLGQDPERRWVLVGDDTGPDPALFAYAASLHRVAAVAVQQLDNDLLAPVVFGKNLQLHALVVLGAIVAGSTLFGTFGAVLAVPVTAVVINVMAEIRADGRAACFL